ncbi:hypothetical protein ACQKMN_03840 [Ureibacillus composti]
MELRKKSYEEYLEERTKKIKEIKSLLSRLETSDKLSNDCLDEIRSRVKAKQHSFLKLIRFCLEKNEKITLDTIENVYMKGNCDKLQDI